MGCWDFFGFGFFFFLFSSPFSIIWVRYFSCLVPLLGDVAVFPYAAAELYIELAAQCSRCKNSYRQLCIKKSPNPTTGSSLGDYTIQC